MAVQPPPSSMGGHTQADDVRIYQAYISYLVDMLGGTITLSKQEVLELHGSQDSIQTEWSVGGEVMTIRSVPAPVPDPFTRGTVTLTGADGTQVTSALTGGTFAIDFASPVWEGRSPVGTLNGQPVYATPDGKVSTTGETPPRYRGDMELVRFDEDMAQYSNLTTGETVIVHQWRGQQQTHNEPPKPSLRSKFKNFGVNIQPANPTEARSDHPE